MAWICISLYPIEKVGNSTYSYPNPVNAGIPVKTGMGLGNTHGAGLFAICKCNRSTCRVGFSLTCGMLSRALIRQKFV